MSCRRTMSSIALLLVLSGIHSSAIAAAVAAAFIDSHTAHVLNHADIEGYCIGGSDDENDIWFPPVSLFTANCTAANRAGGLVISTSGALVRLTWIADSPASTG